MADSKWYSFDTIHKKYPKGVYHFICGGRGTGKSFTSKMNAINDFLEYGHEFVYVRRFVVEMSKVSQFFDDIIQSGIYEGVEVDGEPIEFHVKGTKGYINNKVCCHFIPLSTSANEKSNAYPLVHTIIYDEFVVEFGWKYLRNEVDAFNDLYETIDRGSQRVKAYLLANNLSVVNPYFTYFNLKVKEDSEFVAGPGGLAVVHMYRNDAFIEERKETLFYKMLAGTKYAEFAFENKALRDNQKFVREKRPSGNSRFMFSLLFNGIEYCFWLYAATKNTEAFMYVDRKVEPTSKHRYTVLDDEHTPEKKTKYQFQGTAHFRLLLKCYQENRMYYNNQETQKMVSEIFKKL